MKVIKVVKYHISLFFLLSILGSNALFAQELSQDEIQKQINHPWYIATFQKMSADQKWLTYIKGFNGTKQILVLKNLDYEKEQEFENIIAHDLLDDDYLITYSKDKVLSILDLKTNEIHQIKECQKYFFLNSKTLFLIVNNQQSKSYDSITYNLENEKKEIIDNDIVSFISKEDQNSLVVSKDKLNVFYDFNAGTNERVINESNQKLYDWFFDSDKKTLSVIKQSNSNAEIEIIDLLSHQIINSNSAKFNLDQSSSPKILRVERDKMLIEISTAPKKVQVSDKTPEIWKTSDSIIYPLAKIRSDFKETRQLVLYNYESGRFAFRNLGNNNYKILSTEKFLLFDESIYQDYRSYNAKVDVSIVDIETNNKAYVVRNFVYSYSNLVISPESNLIAYSNNNRWHIYDVNNRISQLVNLQVSKNSLNKRYYSDNRGNSIQWLDNSNLLITNDFSLSLFNLDTLKIKIIFKDDEEETINLLPNDINASEWKKSVRVLFVRNTADRNSEIYSWKDNYLEKLYETVNGIENLTIYNQKLFFSEQNTSLPPAIVRLDKNKSKVLVNTNPNYSKLNWTRKKVIKYNFKEKKLKGILYYPVNYKQGEKYPMVVFIYTKKSTKSKKFNLPTLASEEGFDIDLLTLNNYFVLLPDIDQDKLNPGNSALKCVQKAVKIALISETGINSEAIGLMGHSYGGYETNFIVSQTHLFKAAVSGSGISDLVGWYFSMDWNMKKPEFWRFEDSVFHIGKPFYSEKKSYLSQSPILFAAKVKTPLLIWTGKDDRHVDWEQSVAFHLAMRNSKKNSTLLVYPHEAHAIMNKERAADLTKKVLNWFDHFLKGKKISWISS